jgi:hypothetical protein
MKFNTEFVHEIEIVYETTGDYMTFKFRADEKTDPMEIFKEFTNNCSIIVLDVEEEEVEIEEEETGLKTEQEVSA